MEERNNDLPYFRRSFFEDPWRDLYPADAKHLRDHLDRSVLSNGMEEDDVTLTEVENKEPQMEETETEKETREVCGKDLSRANANADGPPATSIYDFFADTDDIL